LGRLVIGIVGFVLAVILLAVSIPAASDRAMRADVARMMSTGPKSASPFTRLGIKPVRNLG
jgi:hypothetical protein